MSGPLVEGTTHQTTPLVIPRRDPENKLRGILAGMTQYMDTQSTKDGLAVQLVKDLGGVPFCITNVPQTCFSHECCNPIFGATGKN